MKGFEKDKWRLHNFRDGRRIAFHKDFPFIRIDMTKIQKGFNYRAPVWKAEVNSWNLKDKKHRNINISYKKLTAYKIPEIFDKLIKLDSVKEAIFNYLFEGKYDT